MFKRIHMSVRPLIIVSVLLITGCQKTNDQVLATIEGKDTITVGQFTERLAKVYGEKAKSLAYAEKRKFLDSFVQERLKLVYVSEKQDAKSMLVDPEAEKEAVLMNKAYERYILGHFLNPIFVKKYRWHFGETVKLQNLVILYQSENTPAVKTQKIQAQKRADSIFAILDINKFSSVAEKISDYKSPGSAKGNVSVQDMEFGGLPYKIEKELMAMKPNSISRPIDLEWAFVIFYFISTEDSTKVTKSDIEITDHLKAKLREEDFLMLLSFQNFFLDSIFKSAGAAISDLNIRYMLSKIQDSLEIRSAVSRFTPEELDRNLVQFMSGRVTVGNYLGKYPPGLVLKLMPENVVQDLIDLAKRELFMGLSIRDGFLESDEFKSAIAAAIDQKKLKHAVEIMAEESSINIPMTPEEFYSRNRNNYRTDGSIVFSEIYSPSKEGIETCIQLTESGTVFEKIPAMVNTDNKKAMVKLTSKGSLNFKSKGEIASKALQLKRNEISDIIARKEGGFSIIKITEKIEPAFLGFEKVTERIQNELTNNRIKSYEKTLLFKLKKRLKVVIYENNLSSI